LNGSIVAGTNQENFRLSLGAEMRPFIVLRMRTGTRRGGRRDASNIGHRPRRAWCTNRVSWSQDSVLRCFSPFPKTENCDRRDQLKTRAAGALKRALSPKGPLDCNGSVEKGSKSHIRMAVIQGSQGRCAGRTSPMCALGRAFFLNRPSW